MSSIIITVYVCVCPSSSVGGEFYFFHNTFILGEYFRNNPNFSIFYLIFFCPSPNITWPLPLTCGPFVHSHPLLSFNFFCHHCHYQHRIYKMIYMSHFSYMCKLWYPLNLVLESWEHLWSYLTFWVVILDYGLKLHKLSIHTLVML